MPNYNHDKLRGRMAEKKVTIKKIAEVLHVSCETVSRKLFSKTDFKVTEILLICGVLDIPYSQVPDYFFVREN